MTNERLLPLFVCLLLSVWTNAQDLIINYTEPPALVVCDSNEFHFTLTNASPDTLFGIVVTVSTPTGLEYVPGSVSVGTEFDISNLTAPVFEFLPIPPFETVAFSIQAELKCPLVDSINDGALFTNTISAVWDGGTNSVTTIPYIIETPLLVITSITNSIASATQGETIIRTLTIQNTRLGALSSFIFTDLHGGGIQIASPLGTVLSQTTNSFELELTSTDFMTIGDGDGLFELNESITITEIIEITDCGFAVPSTNSLLSVSWGCFGAICQTATQQGLIDLIPSQENPHLDVVATSELPTDYCGGTPSVQTITVTNTGVFDAVDVLLELNLGVSQNGNFAPSAIHPNTFMIDSAGIVEPITPHELNFPANINGCNVPSGLFHQAIFKWDTLAPGATMTLTWEYYYCKDDEPCSNPIRPVVYNYSYLNNCPPDTLSGSGSSISITTGGTNPFDEILRDSMFYFFGEPVLDNSSNTIFYVLESSKLEQPGVLNVEWTLPCGFSWGGSTLEMGGQLPFNTDISTSGNGEVTVIAEYNLPMNSDSVTTSFELLFNCDAPCGPDGGCVEPYITAIGDIGCGEPIEIDMVVSLQEDPNLPLECGMQICRKIELVIECEPDDFPTPGSALFAFLLFENEFQRFNYDFPDNDDNRIPDPSGDLNFNMVRTDRAIPGDTVTTTMNGVLNFPGQVFPVDIDVITVQFEAHTNDNNIDGGVALDYGLNGDLLDAGGIDPVSATLRIFDASTNQTFECDIGNPFNTVDSVHVRFEVVNTEPVQPLGEVLFRQFKYHTSLSDVAGCLPPNFQYGQGDSIILITQHRMVYNPLPQGSDLPPIVNMRSAVVPIFCDTLFVPFITIFEEVHEHFQYSGYKHEIILGSYSALPCEPFDSPGHPLVRFVLGKDNFFPFEYRPLAQLDEWKIEFKTGITMLDAKLQFLRYQQGDNVFSNENLNFNLNPPVVEFDVDDFHIPILDEGWEMSFYHEFEADCTQNTPEPSLFTAEMTISECIPGPSEITVTESTDIFLSAFPNINLGVTLANFTSFDNNASWSLIAINAASAGSLPAENAWIQPISPSGLMTNFQLINTNTGQVVPMINGIFQLGTIAPNEVMNFELTAINNSCEQEVIQLHYGWNCTQYASTAQTPCVDETIILTATSPNGELEMEVTSPVGPFDLCDVIDYHTVEIFNAQLGNVYDILLEVTIPLGLQIVPNSSQMAYPTGAGFVDIPDPTSIGGNLLQWDVSALNNIIQAAGLAGVSQDPDNSVSLRFLTTSECGFIAGSQIIFTVKGKQNCDEPTNTLSKASEPIQITGITPTYTSDINIAINSSTSITCDANVVLSINILPDGSTTDQDTVIITLPPGVNYVPGSYNPVNNAPPNAPVVVDNMGQQILKLKLTPGIAPNTLISFEVETTGYGVTGCGDQVVQVLVVQRQEAVCVTTGELCHVLAQTGSATLTISSEHPDLTLQNLDIVAYGDSVNYMLEIANSGITSEFPIQVDFYVDTDGDGTLSAGDILVGNGVYTGTINANQSVVFEGDITLTNDQLCNLIAVIDESNNCICESEIVPVNFPINSVLDPVVVCSGAEIEIGLASLSNHTYLWDPPGNIGCTDCATTIFQASNNTQDTSVFQYTIIEQTGSCEIQHALDVNVIPIPSIHQEDLEICAGETVILEATPGGTYNWQGPGITNPNQQTQELTLFENASYTVTINLPPGCDGMDEINITVLPFQEGFSQISTCPDDPVMIFNELTSTPGIYCDTLPNLVGCDSLICIELTNFTTATEELYELCPGDSVNIDGVTYFQDDVICNTMVSANGCDSTHCIIIETIPEPLVETMVPDITIAQGDEVQLIVTDTFINYQWSPTIGLSCTDCHNPFTTAELLETTEYSVTVTDAKGCTSQLILLVTVFPPCSSDRIQIPNVFTPDNDGNNDKFGVVEFEGFEMVSSIKIFNRWGEKVFEDSGADAMWDGTQKGKPAPADVYVYIIRIVCDDGEGVLHGDVTLVR